MSADNSIRHSRKKPTKAKENLSQLKPFSQSKPAKPKRYKTMASVPYRHGASQGVGSQQRDEEMEEGVHVQQGGGVRVVHRSYRLLKDDKIIRICVIKGQN